MMLTNIMRPGNLAKFAAASRWQCFGLAAGLALLILTGCGPPGPRALHRGDRLIQNGQYEDAIEPLKEAVIDLSHSQLVQARAYNLLGVAEQGARHFQPAWQAYQQALKLDRNLAVVDYNLGCVAIQQSDYPAAISALTTFTTLRPRDADGFSRLGDAYLRYSFQLSPRDRARIYEAAHIAYDNAEKFSPSAETVNALGMAQLQRHPGAPSSDDMKIAVRAFQIALERSSNYPPALLNLAILDQEYLGDFKGALDRYHQYLALDPPPANTNEVDRVARQLEIESRIQIVQHNAPRPAPAPVIPPASNTVAAVTKPPPRVVATTPERPINVVTQKPPSRPSSETYAANRVAPPASVEQPSPPPVTYTPPPTPTPTPTENPPEPSPASMRPAVTETTPTTTLDAGSPQTGQPGTTRPKRSFLDRLNPRNWLSSKKPAPAADKATPVPEENANSRYVHPLPITPIPGNRADAQRYFQEAVKSQRDGRLEDAQGYYSKALDIDSTYFQAALSLGLVSIDAKDYATALTSLDRALKLESDSADARYAFAWVLQKKSYYDDAADELEKLLAQHPDQVRGHLLLGNLYAQKLDKPRLAREHYLTVLTLDPQSSQTQTIHNWLNQNQ